MSRQSAVLGLLMIIGVLSVDRIPRPHFSGDPIVYPEDYCLQIQDYQQFDFIVVGAGPAGCAVARRLAEIPTNRVLLLEAGGNPPPISDIPGNTDQLGFDLRWKFHTERDAYECLGFTDNTCKMVPGMVLGGSSTLNSMMYVRGNPEDFNEWAQLGNIGWDYQSVLPYFKKLENYLAQPIVPKGKNGIQEVSSTFHSVGGPLTSSAFQLDPHTQRARDGIFQAFAAYGIHRNTDVNSNYQIGITDLPGMIDALGYRNNAAKAYLLDIPENLKVCKHAIVHKVDIDPVSEPKLAKSVEFIHSSDKNKRKLHAIATKEYIISGGALHSPGILERSGIGIPEVLVKAGVKPVLNLKVGENFQDQFLNCGSAFMIDYGSDTYSNPLTIEMSSLTAFINVSDPGSPSPDIQYILKTYNPAVGSGISFKPDILAQYQKAAVGSGKDLLTAANIILRQAKFGSIHISQATDPKKSPKIISNQFRTRQEVELTVKSTRLMRKIMSHPVMQQFKTKPFLLDECKMFPFNSEEEIMCGARQIATSLYHQCGTCYMGPSDNPNSVVDPQLRVIGTQNLRVIDSSIMPLVTRGNTEIPTVMIGEKGADLVKAFWGQL